LTASVAVIFTEIIERNKEYDPMFVYTSCRNLFLNAEKDAAQKGYIIETDFYRKLFFLALALDNLGELNQSGYIFNFLSESSVKNNFTDIAARIKKAGYSASYKDGVKKAFLFSVE
jgi:GH15 family glucan-1,4-alpha-glucosidase